MSQRDRIADMDARLHRAFTNAGLAGTGTYTAPNQQPLGNVRVYVDKGAQEMGSYSQRVGPQVTITLLRADVPQPMKNAIVDVDGERWRLVSPTDDADDGITKWVVEATNV